jgi:adenylate cyclase
MARLIFGTPQGERAIELQIVNGLGRHPANTLQLMDKIASKEHAVVELRGNHYILRDLGSLNGTYVNGERVSGERSLRHGDEIEIGMTRARFDDGMSPRTYPKLPISPEVIQNRGSGVGPPPPAAPRAPMATPTPPPSPTPSPYSTQPRAYPSTTPGVVPVPAAAQRDRRASTMAPESAVEMHEAARRIGAQVDSKKGFMPFEQIAANPQQLRLDYEALRMIYELSRAIGLVHDLDKLMRKILQALFHFVPADRGVILMIQPDSTLKAAANYRRDGSNAPIRVSKTILGHVIKEKKGVLTQDAAQDFGSMNDGRSMMLNRISSAIVVPLLHEDDLLGALWLDSEMLNQFTQKDLELVQAVASQAAMFIANALLTTQIEKEIITRERFSRLLSPNVAEQVIAGKLDVRQGGVYVKECTVFNSDIRGFTHMSEGIPAEVMIDVLNEYFEVMVEVIFRHEGTLDKFMGDGIMAFWGAPVAHADGPLRAVRCAVEQMDALARFNRDRQTRGVAPFDIGIGIHTGPLVSGYVGSSKALGYTVIGDTANTSARICSIAAPGQIVVSEQTAEHIRGQFRLEELPPAVLKGKERPLRLFNVKR